MHVHYDPSKVYSIHSIHGNSRNSLYYDHALHVYLVITYIDYVSHDSSSGIVAEPARGYPWNFHTSQNITPSSFHQRVAIMEGECYTDVP